MTNIIFSRKEFESHLKLTPEIQEKITLFGTPLESVTGDSVEIEIFPNRPDMLSLEGFMRSFKKFLGKEPGIKRYDIKKPEKDYRLYVDKSVKEIRPYVACAIVKKVQINDDRLKGIINMQEKLALTLGRNRKKMAIGIYPLDKITLPLTYIAKDPKEIKYHALGGDREMNAEEILIMHPTGRKYEHLLKSQKKYPVFIDSAKKIISMPPIINSELTGRVSLSTKDLFIECTGTDKPAVEKTLAIIATSLAELGGAIYQMEIVDREKYFTPSLVSQKVKVNREHVNKLLGINVTEAQLSSLLSKMGHNYKSGTAEVAPWRIDVLHEVDLIEDAAIAYGYNNFVPEIPNISTPGEESRESILKRRISEILIGLEMLELSTYHLIKHEEVENYSLKDALELLDSKNEYKYLRPNLFVPLMRIISENKDVEYPQKVFEMGRVFSKGSQKENGVEEKDSLVLGLIPANATEMKKHLDYFFKMLELEYSIKEASRPHMIEGRTAAIIVNNKQIGYFGEVHPNALKSQGILMPLAVAEISLEEIYSSV